MPCALNTITVALRSNVPLLTTEQAGCAPMLTLSGLSGSATMGDHLNISGAATTVLQTRAPWTQATGTLELSPSVGRFEAGVEYTFTFALNNSAVPQVCQTPNLQPRRPQLSLHPRLPPLIPKPQLLNAEPSNLNPQPLPQNQAAPPVEIQLWNEVAGVITKATTNLDADQLALFIEQADFTIVNTA